MNGIMGWGEGANDGFQNELILFDPENMFWIRDGGVIVREVGGWTQF